VSRFLILLLISVFTINSLQGQSAADSIKQVKNDSVQKTVVAMKKDSISSQLKAIVTDSISYKPLSDSGWVPSQNRSFNAEFREQLYSHSHYFGFIQPALQVVSDKKIFIGKELLFYLLVGLMLVFAVLRQVFPKYFNDLFRVFFRTTLKQKQVREQLLQTPLPSLIMNGFFVVTSGLYISLLLGHYHHNPFENFWLLTFYTCLAIGIVYLVKFIGLRFSGWIFNISEATDSYTFIVFITNKMIGILLLPFIVLLAFSDGQIYSAALVLSWCIVGGLIFYRFILSYGIIRNQIKVNLFHFFLYLCAFEIAPLLLIYKVLIAYFK
jgi:hypothetical protein